MFVTKTNFDIKFHQVDFIDFYQRNDTLIKKKIPYAQKGTESKLQQVLMAITGVSTLFIFRFKVMTSPECL